jgi:hypothetical protein
MTTATTRAPRKAFKLIPSNSVAFSSVAPAGDVEVVAVVEVLVGEVELDRFVPVGLRLDLRDSDIVSDRLVARLDARLVSLVASSVAVEAMLAILATGQRRERQLRA